ncbi:MAG: alpha/beta hydrolase [Thermodesulfobacteriota bacterium]
MTSLQQIDGRRIACWVNHGGFHPGRKTLVFIHGSGGDHTNWLRQYTALKDAFNMAAVDLPGHGRSEGPGERAVAAYVEWMKKILDGLGISKPVLIGHSLGAAIGLGFAIRYGEAVAAVVPVGGGLKMPVNPMLLEGLTRDPAAVIDLIATFSIARQNREKFSRLIEESLSRVDPELLHGDFSACSALDITDAAATVRIPVLAICGAQDKMTPPALSQSICDRIPGARLVLIENAGHFVMMENPEAFNAALADFVHART